MRISIIIATVAFWVAASISDGAMQQVFGILTFIGIVICFSILHGYLVTMEKDDFK